MAASTWRRSTQNDQNLQICLSKQRHLAVSEAFLSVVTSEDDFPSARTEINLLSSSQRDTVVFSDLCVCKRLWRCGRWAVACAKQFPAAFCSQNSRLSVERRSPSATASSWQHLDSSAMLRRAASRVSRHHLQSLLHCLALLGSSSFDLGMDGVDSAD